MRPTLALAIVSVLVAGPALGADTALQVSCRQFVAGYKNNRSYLRSASSVMSFVQDRDGFQSAYGSECNVMEIVRAECIANPKMHVIDALENLFANDRAGKPLPSGRVCGA